MRSCGCTTLERNAERGAWSMLLIALRRTRKRIVRGRVGARGREARKREEGRCVITMAGMRPRRREREPEKMLPRVERNLGWCLVRGGNGDVGVGLEVGRWMVTAAGRGEWEREKGEGDAYHVALIMPPSFPLGRWNLRSR